MAEPTDPAEAQADIEALAVRAAAGDQEALDPLLKGIRPLVVDHCRRILRNAPGEAEDAAQETLLRVFRGISSFDGRARFSTWLWPVTLRAGLDALRKLKAQATSNGGVEGTDPRTTSLIAGTRIDVVDALESIHPIYAQAVALRDLCERSYAEIAEVLGITEGTARRRVSVGRALIRAHLGAG